MAYTFPCGEGNIEVCPDGGGVPTASRSDSAGYFSAVRKREGLENTHVLKLMLGHCLGHPASLFSPHRFHQQLRSQGVRVAKDTVYAYLDHLTEAFVLYPVSKWNRSLRVRSSNPSKVYHIDNGLAGRFSVSADRGKRLENAVYHHLRKRFGDLYYLSNGREVDLAVAGPNPTRAWNVAWSIVDSETASRELEALQWAEGKFDGLETELVAHEVPENRAFPRSIRSATSFLLDG